MKYPKAIMTLDEMKKLGLPKSLLLKSRMEKGQTFVFKANPAASNSKLLYDTEGFEKWRIKQARILTESISR